jgi:ribosomal protein L12E/L44/L45/RPP1/RPP2
MTSTDIQDAYPLSALFIHACGMEVTQERIKTVFKTLGVEFKPRFGELFSLPGERYEELLAGVSSVSAAPVAQAPVATEEKKVAEEEPKEEAEEDGFGLDFDDLFG